MFPEGLFYILSRKHGFALDVYDGQTKEDANIIVWPQKFQDSDNQLWTYEGGRLINKKSGHALDISSSAFKRDKTIVQKKKKPTKQSQEWIYDQGFICSKEYPSLVLDIRGDSAKGGAQVLLYKRKDVDNLNQLWQFESFQNIEGALSMVTTTLPLHKKEGFGQPRPGYAAEVGVPPELTKLPENNKIAGVGNNISPTPTTVAGGNSRVDPLLAQYGSFYGGSTTTNAPPPQPISNYPPPPLPPKTNDNYPPPAPQPISNYPPPPMNNNYPTSPTQTYQSSGYSTSPPNQSFPSFNQPGYPPPASNYPPPPSNYPPPSPNVGMMPSPNMMPTAENYGVQNNYPAPPPLPNRNNNTDQYGYPNYPQ